MYHLSLASLMNTYDSIFFSISSSQLLKTTIHWWHNKPQIYKHIKRKMTVNKIPSNWMPIYAPAAASPLATFIINDYTRFLNSVRWLHYWKWWPHFKSIYFNLDMTLGYSFSLHLLSFLGHQCSFTLTLSKLKVRT